MIAVMAQAFSSQGIDIEYAVTGRSLAIAYALGVLLTLAVVAVSALAREPHDDLDRHPRPAGAPVRGAAPALGARGVGARPGGGHGRLGR